MDTQIVITLLTIAVSLLSVGMLALLIIVIAIVVKVRNIARSLERTMDNVASATEWLTPAKTFSQIIKLFRK
jgi:uncharacterized protein YoxC